MERSSDTATGKPKKKKIKARRAVSTSHSVHSSLVSATAGGGTANRAHPNHPNHLPLAERAPNIKRIRVYRNGDAYHNGISIVLNMRQVHGIDSFLDAISERIGLVQGAKRLYTLEGRRIHSTDNLENNKEYVASSGGFIPLAYGSNRPPTSNAATVRSASAPRYRRNTAPASSPHLHKDNTSVSLPPHQSIKKEKQMGNRSKSHSKKSVTQQETTATPSSDEQKPKKRVKKKVSKEEVVEEAEVNHKEEGEPVVVGDESPTLAANEVVVVAASPPRRPSILSMAIGGASVDRMPMAGDLDNNSTSGANRRNSEAPSSVAVVIEDTTEGETNKKEAAVMNEIEKKVESIELTDSKGDAGAE